MKTLTTIIAVHLGLLTACACQADRVVGNGIPGDHQAPGRFVPEELVHWFLDDLWAIAIGLEGNVVGIARLDTGALIPRYDRHGGKHWPYEDIHARQPVTHLGEVFLIHDEQYEQDVALGQMSLLDSDLSLIDNMWSLSLDRQPGPVGHAYRILATVAFGLKTSAWNWWQ